MATDVKMALSNGGSVTVLYTTTGLVKEYQANPRVNFIDCKVEKSLGHLMPDNTRAIIICDGIGPLHYQFATAYCRQKDIPWVLRKSNQAVYEQLKLWFNGDEPKHASLEETKDTFVRGKLTPLATHIKFEKSNSENAKILFRMALGQGIKTTENSLAQFVAQQRRKLSGTAPVKSARPKLDVSVEMLDSMIKELTDMREFLIETCEENRILRTKVEKFKKVMED